MTEQKCYYVKTVGVEHRGRRRTKGGFCGRGAEGGSSSVNLNGHVATEVSTQNGKRGVKREKKQTGQPITKRKKQKVGATSRKSQAKGKERGGATRANE